jgi:putative ABC transport system ATP-binding protein
VKKKTDAIQTVLEARLVEKTFMAGGKAVRVLRGASLAARAGEVTVVTGQSGEGKSVLFWLLAALDTPTAGAVFFEGTDLAGLSEGALGRLRRNKISIIFQDYNLVASFTALENVMAPLAESRRPKLEQRARAEKILSSLGLWRRLHHLPAELSVGQRQRVAVARTMIVSPRLILADEPTGGLDPETAADLVELLVGQARRTGAALVVATHGLFPPEVADRVYRLKSGRLMLLGKGKYRKR